MLRFSSRSELLVPLPPLKAYADDVERLSGRSPIGAADDVWLVAAHALTRAASLPRAERAALFFAAADGMEGVATEALAVATPSEHEAAERSQRTAVAAAGALRSVARLLEGQPTADFDVTLGTSLDALRELVAEQEQAGAFSLAFSTLAAIRQALAPMLDANGSGLLLTQQGRAARQLGALETASELYEAAVREARAAGTAGVAARALMGLGVLASMRGNYPGARDNFRQAIVAAREANAIDLERGAHNGLLFAAIAARDVEAALTHGWAAYERTSADLPEARAEVLVNLAEAGRLAGEHRAALGSCLAALELTNVARIRLPALGTAVREAALLGESRLVQHLVDDAERALLRSGQPFENARLLVELAEALVDTHGERAAGYATRAADVARASGFYEVAMRSEQVLESLRAGVTRTRRRKEDGAVQETDGWKSPKVRAVVRSMELLPTLSTTA